MSVVVLAYHEMGCLGLETLLAHGVEVSLVFTHEDDPGENQWYRSVAQLAREHGIETHTPEDINAPEWVEKIEAAQPDVLFSFHYRQIVKRAIRRIPKHGCVNLHPSLLPKYRGRCPLNWVLVHGEAQTGVTLHRMVARADAGDIIAQRAVEIGPDDTALELYKKLMAVARPMLEGVLDQVLDGTAPRTPQDDAQATKLGGRRPEDGRIDWSWPAARIHNLVRAVAPPWPPAFCEGAAGRVSVERTRLAGPAAEAPALKPGEVWEHAGRTFVQTGDGLIELLEVSTATGKPLAAGTSLA